MSGERYIIAVAAPVGGGKTTLVNGLANALDDACQLYFDHYEQLTELPVDAVSEDDIFASYRLPRLADDLNKLKQGLSIVDPVSGEEIGPARYVILELPLGRQLQDTAALLDLLIWIDTPLDAALARKIKDFTLDVQGSSHKGESAAFVSWLSDYLESYLSGTRLLLETQQQLVAPDADLRLDGLEQPNSILQKSLIAIQERFVS